MRYERGERARLTDPCFASSKKRIALHSLRKNSCVWLEQPLLGGAALFSAASKPMYFVRASAPEGAYSNLFASCSELAAMEWGFEHFLNTVLG
jgi:hypothetical protein